MNTNLMTVELSAEERRVCDETKRRLGLTSDEELAKLGLFKAAHHADVKMSTWAFLATRRTRRHAG